MAGGHGAQFGGLLVRVGIVEKVPAPGLDARQEFLQPRRPKRRMDLHVTVISARVATIARCLVHDEHVGK